MYGEVKNILEVICNEAIEFNLRIDRLWSSSLYQGIFEDMRVVGVVDRVELISSLSEITPTIARAREGRIRW